MGPIPSLVPLVALLFGLFAAAAGALVAVVCLWLWGYEANVVNGLIVAVAGGLSGFATAQLFRRME